MVYYAAKRREAPQVTGREVMKKIVEDNKWTVAEFARRCGTTTPTMWDRLNSTKVKDIPLSMLKQYMPLEYAEVRAGRLAVEPAALVKAHVRNCLDQYHVACVVE
jgi:hypothetical protein